MKLKALHINDFYTCWHGKAFFFIFYFADLFYETGDSSLVLKLRMQYMQIIIQVDA